MSTEPGQPTVRPYLRAAAGPAGGDEPAEPGGLRPFVLASGRVESSDPEIRLETQVTARQGAGPVGALAPELQAIMALCREPLSVAEISARTRLHLGVTKVLVGDLRAAGHLDVHTGDAVNPLDADTILRVIRGLRGIT